MYSQIREAVEQLNSIASAHHFPHLNEQCAHLITDIQQDAYSFIVVGEFSTGKSTFINGLMGKSLLPTGITPTTSTINILQYGEPAIAIHFLNGEEEHVTDMSRLHDFIASKLDEVDSINYIGVFQPLEFLQNRTMVIDTPGLNDVNELRSDITYQYIPRADVMFFLLDCRTPLRASEFEFLTETLVAQGLDRIIFIANFADDVDEDELPFIIEKMENKLKEGLQLDSVEIIAYSALEALEGKAEQDEELLEISGYNRVVERMQVLCEDNTRKAEKCKRFEQREHMIRQELVHLLHQKQKLNNHSKEELQQELEKLVKWREGQEAVIANLRKYYEERVFDFERMASKSVRTFFEKAESSLIEEIELFQGNNIQHFFEKRLPSIMNNKLKNWIEQYSPQLQILIAKLEEALTDILTDLLNEKVYTNQFAVEPELSKGGGVEIEIAKKPDPTIASGLIVGGTSALFLILGGPILLPIIGMVGLPYLQKKLIEDQLKKIKPQVISDLQMKIMIVRHDFEQEIHQYLRTNCEKVYESCIRIYEQRIEQQSALIQQRLQELKSSAEDGQQENVVIQQQLIAIQTLKLEEAK
ncbi:dynamin family protein [Solibacillus sp. MA9]|uniref:Dynamin family protein n=1 Tax=Solibacillus palustris TaxID=2908203 RepID=A0ABS9UAW0_9BACL|nr:dynamin family protein [Solibacillus sp. MA9]MCH7321483.1 dynamin family protein [Solibacillus sp. MA9]